MPESIVTTIPIVHVKRWRGLPASGMAARDGKGWIILLNADESEERQRFTLLHEFAHIVFDRRTDEAAPHDGLARPWQRSEHDCNYFAACVLMPASWIKADWNGGLRDQQALARRYGVHPRGIQLRLMELGLIEPGPEDEWMRHLLRIRANAMQGGAR